ncbi:MAG TPA: SH3 domain-containing protein [Lautropia sp.]|jgi:uncharacterized protein YraI|nr:SH3 domain-containing protein [Lautropia sp.]
MTRTRICTWIAGLAFALPVAAMADEAYTTTAVNLRAGPDSDYPLVRWLPEGTAVEVRGCLADYRWCDVEAYGDRGWVSASYLVYPYQNSNVPIVTYGPVIGLPLIGFTFDSYWNDHYQRRPWYVERHRWADRYRPDYDAPRYRQPRAPEYYPRESRPPQYYPRDNRGPQYYPRDNRPPQYNPPSVRPEFRPPQVQPQPMPPLQNRQPSFGDRDNRNFSPQPNLRSAPEMRAPMPQTVRPQAAPAVRQPSERSSVTPPRGPQGRNLSDTQGPP